MSPELTDPVPVLIVISPELPPVPLTAVSIVTPPDVFLEENPLDSTILPPFPELEVVFPALKLIFPPFPTAPEPTRIEILPPLPAVAVPVDNIINPLGPWVATPESNLTNPETPDTPAFLVPMMIFPLLE
jgi:hypothetical protein